MKIGILSMQRILNYGSFLQALSLKMQFEQRGHDVYFIDIKPGRTIIPFIEGVGNLSKKLDKYIFKRIENFFFSREMAKIHLSDIHNYLDIDKQISDNEMFDLAVIGSDEVFNASIASRWGFTTQLFGRVDNAKIVVTYAASCGSTTVEKVRELHIDYEISQALQTITRISVRDWNSCDFVRRMIGVNPEINVDPVFLSNYDKYIPHIKRIHKPFLLVYAYGNRITAVSEIHAIKQYAQKYNLDILCVGMQQRWCQHNITANAFELLAYVKQSQCVVTDTFHGTVFSIKYNKRFVSFIRESNRQKLEGLLTQFGLINRAVKNMSAFEDTIDMEIDYSKVNSVVRMEQLKSGEYIDAVCKLAER